MLVARIAMKGTEEEEGKGRQLRLPSISSSFRVPSAAASEVESAAALATRVSCQLETNQVAIKLMIICLKTRMFK